MLLESTKFFFCKDEYPRAKYFFKIDSHGLYLEENAIIENFFEVSKGEKKQREAKRALCEETPFGVYKRGFFESSLIFFG